MTRTYSRFLTAFFCLFLGGLLAWHVFLPDRARSETENRTLAQRPVFSWAALADGSFTADVEDYFADQFPLRDGWTGLKARAEQLLGKREFNGVYLCGDTLIAKVDPPPENLEKRNLTHAARLAERTEIPVYLGLIPSAAEIWREKLPAGAESWDQSSFIAQGAALEGVKPVDLLGALSAHAGEDIFYRTDHHWTSLGAYYGYAALMETLGRADEVVPLSQYQKTTVSTEFYGTVFSSSGVRWVAPDEMDVYVPEDGVTVTSPTYGANWQLVSEEARQLYDESYLAKKDKYSMFLGGQQALGVVKTPNADKPKLLLVRDSYSDSLVPFLTPHFSEIHLVDLRYNKQSTTQYIKDNGIDLAVVLYSVPNFVSDSNLVWLGR